jgi:hypothetical protein
MLTNMPIEIALSDSTLRRCEPSSDYQKMSVVHSCVEKLK